MNIWWDLANFTKYLLFYNFEPSLNDILKNLEHFNKNLKKMPFCPHKNLQNKADYNNISRTK